MNKKVTYFSMMVLFTFAFLKISNAQTPDEIPPPVPAYDTTDNSKFVSALEEAPTYKYGGEEGMINFIRENIIYPGDSVKGNVYVSFIVDKSGVLKDIKLLKGLSPEANKEAIRLTNLLEFNPGRQNGKPVSVVYNLPIRFSPEFYEKHKHKNKKNK